jgi:Phage integrase family
MPVIALAGLSFAPISHPSGRITRNSVARAAHRTFLTGDDRLRRFVLLTAVAKGVRDIGERTMGPIILGIEGGRMYRYCADRMVKRLVKRAGIDKRISSHSLRHSFITAALDAGVPLRDVPEAASHADPRTTMRYDGARRSLDRHATCIVSTFIAGATRPGLASGSRVSTDDSGCMYNACMPNVQIREVPEDVHNELVRRAELAGQSLQQYLSSQLAAMVATPTIDDVIARIEHRPKGRLSRTDAVSAIADERARR